MFGMPTWRGFRVTERYTFRRSTLYSIQRYRLEPAVDNSRTPPRYHQLFQVSNNVNSQGQERKARSPASFSPRSAHRVMCSSEPFRNGYRTQRWKIAGPSASTRHFLTHSMRAKLRENFTVKNALALVPAAIFGFFAGLFLVAISVDLTTETSDTEQQTESDSWDASQADREQGVRHEGETEHEAGYKNPIYKPLKGAEIRVLSIHPGIGDDPLQTTLEHRASLQDGEYEAISYAWGSRHRTHLIRESDSEVHITQNLHEALQRLRLEDQPRKIWVDAICINQDDDIEKGIQVQMMQQIYANAGQVIVWLGEDNEVEKSASAFKDISLISWFLDAARIHVDVELETSFKSAISKQDWQGDLWTDSFHEPSTKLQESLEPLANLLCRSWFRRTWIVQEVASSKKAILMCGGNTMPWKTFAAVCLKYQYHQRAIRQLEKSYRGHDFGIQLESYAYGGSFPPALSHTDLLEHPTVKRSLERIATIERARSSQNGTGAPVTLFEVLLATSFNSCSDRRDKVFGVLGLPHDYLRLGGLTPNYDKQTTVSRVFKDFAAWDIQNSGKLRVLSCSSRSVWDALSLELVPSWVPDWGSPSMDPYPFVRYSETTQFRASGLSLAKFTVAGDGILEVTGKEMDSVKATGPLLELESEPRIGMFSHDYGYTENLQKARRWLRECKYFACDMSPKRFDQLWRTMTCGLTGEAEPVPAEYADYFWDYLRFVDNLWESLQYAIGYRDRASGPYHRAEGLSEREIKKFGAIESSISRWSSKRRLCATIKGDLACVPQETEPGDIITVLYGSDVPYVLRRVSPELWEKWHRHAEDRRLGHDIKGNVPFPKLEQLEKSLSNSTSYKIASIEQDGYIVVGECYIHGFMHGEALHDMQVEERKFRIH